MSKLSDRLNASKDDDLGTNLVYKLKTYREKIKQAQEVEKKLTKKLSEIAETKGQKDGKGNRAFKMGDYIFVRQKIQGAPSIDEKALYKLFKAKGFPPPYTVQKVRVFDEDVYDRFERRLTDDEREKIVSTPEPYYVTRIRHVGSKEIDE